VVGSAVVALDGDAAGGLLDQSYVLSQQDFALVLDIGVKDVQVFCPFAKLKVIARSDYVIN
jgi:hypothetical protein